jgi:hypothetical protein
MCIWPVGKFGGSTAIHVVHASAGDLLHSLVLLASGQHRCGHDTTARRTPMDTFYVRVIRRIDVVRRHVPRLGPDMIGTRLPGHAGYCAIHGRKAGLTAGQDVASRGGDE